MRRGLLGCRQLHRPAATQARSEPFFQYNLRLAHHQATKPPATPTPAPLPPATSYPLVPGHEIVGIVAAVGPQVTKFKVGDRAGVGTYVDTCRNCALCKAGEDQFCAEVGGEEGERGSMPL